MQPLLWPNIAPRFTDVIDLSGIEARKVFTGPESGFIEYLDAAGNVTHTASFSEIERVICFTPDTQIATPNGLRAVEDLREGDRVITRDNGIQTLRWTGRKALDTHALQSASHLRPILIRRGALGDDLPMQDMMVSPNHRMLIRSDMSQLMFGEREVLVAAKYLTGFDGVDQVAAGGVSYLHLLFDQHEVILADGAWSESFQPGEYALNGLEQATRDEILELFPALATASGTKAYRSARLTLKGYGARLLAA